MQNILNRILLILLIPLFLFAEEIEIKGLRIGLDKDQVLTKSEIGLKKSDKPDITYDVESIMYYAGNKEKYYTPGDYTLLGNKIFNLELFFQSNKLDLIVFTLYPSTFDAIIAELKKKYPQMTCDNSVLQNGYGATYNQVLCKLKNDNSTLFAQKYFTWNLERGSIKIVSNESLSDFDENIKKSKNDL